MHNLSICKRIIIMFENRNILINVCINNGQRKPLGRWFYWKSSWSRGRQNSKDQICITMDFRYNFILLILFCYFLEIIQIFFVLFFNLERDNILSSLALEVFYSSFLDSLRRETFLSRAELKEAPNKRKSKNALWADLSLFPN